MAAFASVSRLFYPEKIIRSELYILEYFTLTEKQIQTLNKRSKIQRIDNGMAKIKGQRTTNNLQKKLHRKLKIE